MDLKVVGCKDVDWIDLDLDMIYLWAALIIVRLEFLWQLGDCEI
jgi:hypothetical protein